MSDTEKFKHKIEIVRDIYLADGSRYEIGLDREGFEAIEIRFIDSENVQHERVMIARAAARCVSEALAALVNEHCG